MPDILTTAHPPSRRSSRTPSRRSSVTISTPPKFFGESPFTANAIRSRWSGVNSMSMRRKVCGPVISCISVEQFGRRLAGDCHALEEEECAERSVAFGDVSSERVTAALFATEDAGVVDHGGADELEAHGCPLQVDAVMLR